jgi:oxalate decarboxylase
VPGDVWYFPKGIAHVIQGLDDENEYLLAFDDGDFDKVGTTFMVDDWLLHTPADIVAQSFGVNESVFENLPETDPYILNATVSDEEVTAPENEVLTGASSFVYVARDNPAEPVPGGGGTFRKVDTTTFPISETIAAAFVTLEPGGLRELHWHPNVSETLLHLG